MPVDPSADAHLVEHRIDSQPLLSGHFLHAFRDTVRLPNGATATREYIRHPGAVMVIALHQPPGQPLHVVMERQFRYPVRQVMTEFPAGKLDPGEDPLACAQRELLEETGYAAREWAHAGLLHPAIGYSNECISIWFCRHLSLHPRQLDEGEFLDVFLATPQTLLQDCARGAITDAKTLTGLLWLQQVLAGQWPLAWQAAPPPLQPESPQTVSPQPASTKPAAPSPAAQPPKAPAAQAPAAKPTP